VGAKGDAGPAGPAGAKGDRGERGEKGEPGMSLRLVQPRAPSAVCEQGEVMISAFCSGAQTRNPLTTSENGAKCGPDSKANRSEVTIVCARM
jgi:hypothetical protein